jgi:hypothetical protein
MFANSVGYKPARQMEVRQFYQNQMLILLNHDVLDGAIVSFFGPGNPRAGGICVRSACWAGPGKVFSVFSLFPFSLFFHNFLLFFM